MLFKNAIFLDIYRIFCYNIVVKMIINLNELSKEDLIKKLNEANALIDKQNDLLFSKDERIRALEKALKIKQERDFIRKADKAYEDSMPLFNDIEFSNKEEEIFSEIKDDLKYEKVAEYKRKKLC